MDGFIRKNPNVADMISGNVPKQFQDVVLELLLVKKYIEDTKTG